MLPYALPLPWYRRRLWLKFAAMLLLLVAGILGGRISFRLAAAAQRNRAIAREQNDMLTFSQSGTQVVYEEDQARCRQLLASGKGYQQWPWARPASEVAAWGSPVMFARPTGFPRDARIDYLGEAGLFLHRRISPAGHERIVSLSPPAIYYFCRHYRQIGFCFSVGKPAAVPGAFPAFDSFIPHVLPLTGDERLRMFAGQPDPTNLSHWTIGYELNGQAGTIDGYLKDNDGISLDVRDGPLMNRLIKPSMSQPGPCALEHR